MSDDAELPATETQAMTNATADAIPPTAETTTDAPTTITRKASLPRRIWLLLVVALVVIVTDQITKRLIEANIGLYENAIIFSWLSPYLTFTHTQNTGAAFSLLPEGGAIFFVIGIIVCSLILYYAPRLPVSDWVSRVALGMQLGGALGNLIDRFRQGHVTDFIHFQIPEIGFDFPVWNIADSCIVVGVIILIAINILRPEPTA